MNNWKIVGILFLIFGVLILFGGLFWASTVGSVAQVATDTANSFMNLIPQQTGSVVFMFAFAPFAFGAIVCFIIAGIGLVVGSKQDKQALPPPPPQAY